MESASGIGSNADSFYEYLLKNYILFDTHNNHNNHKDKEDDVTTSSSHSSSSSSSSSSMNAYESYLMFIDTYTSIKKYVQYNDWFTEVDMYNHKTRRNRVESLHGFWPGMESSVGLIESSANILNALYGLWIDLGFLPEELDQVSVCIS